jgi:hypothetical protein
MAQAEDGKPAILCFEKGCAPKLTATLAGKTKSELVQLAEALTITATEVEIKIKNCDALAGTEEKDTAACKDQEIVFKGTESKKQPCKTGTLAAGTVSALLDLKLAAEETAAKVLQPLLLAKVLNSELKPELLLSCGVIKEAVKGTVGCLLLPGLTLTAKYEALCKINAKFDPETGTCTVECAELKEDPFLSKLGEKFEDAWMEIKLSGEANKEVFGDD